MVSKRDILKAALNREAARVTAEVLKWQGFVEQGQAKVAQTTAALKSRQRQLAAYQEQLAALNEELDKYE